MSSIEQLGITPIENIEEIFDLSDPVIKPALKAGDLQLARTAIEAVARILEKTGHVSTLLADSYIQESEQKITNLE